MRGIRRREFISVLGGAAAWPIAARAQQTAIPVVGYLGTASRESDTQSGYLPAFRKGLDENGFVEGRNIAIEFRGAEGQFDRFPALVTDLIRRKVAVIFVRSLPAAQAAKKATGTIPIVFSMGEDPVKEGIVLSLNRPGGNLTGFTDFSNQLAGKRLGLLRDIARTGTALGFLVNPNNPNAETDARDAQVAATALGRELRVLKATTDADLDDAFAEIAPLRIGAVLVNIDPLFDVRRDHLIVLASRHAVPVMHYRRDYAEAGGLISYGADIAESFHQSGIYVGRILKGNKPADLPVQQATNFELVINLRTAKALGITIPEGLIVAADHVIE
jgi:putative ABC transport system substrate-binding protein